MGGETDARNVDVTPKFAKGVDFTTPLLIMNVESLRRSESLRKRDPISAIISSLAQEEVRQEALRAPLAKLFEPQLRRFSRKSNRLRGDDRCFPQPMC